MTLLATLVQETFKITLDPVTYMNNKLVFNPTSQAEDEKTMSQFECVFKDEDAQTLTMKSLLPEEADEVLARAYKKL